MAKKTEQSGQNQLENETCKNKSPFKMLTDLQ